MVEGPRGVEVPRGVSSTGGERIAPYIIVDDEEDGAQQEGCAPSSPQERERAPGGGSEMHPQPVAPEGPIEPRPAAGAEVEGSAEASRAETTVEAPVQLLGRRGFTRRPLALREAPRGHQAPRRVLPPEQGMYWFLNFLLIFCFSLSSNSRCLISHQPKAQCGFSGTCSPEGRGGGLSQPLGQRGPGRCPPRAVKRASSPTRKGGRRRGGRRQIPR